MRQCAVRWNVGLQLAVGLSCQASHPRFSDVQGIYLNEGAECEVVVRNVNVSRVRIGGIADPGTGILGGGAAALREVRGWGGCLIPFQYSIG